MSGKNSLLTKNVFVHISSVAEESGKRGKAITVPCISILNSSSVALYSQYNELYKKYSYERNSEFGRNLGRDFSCRGRIFDHKDSDIAVISEIVEQVREKVTVEKENMCFVGFGENAFGKSLIMGTLPCFSDNEHNIGFYTLVTLFYQIDQERSRGMNTYLKIKASEVFEDQIIDLVKGQYKEARAECSYATAEDINDAVATLQAIYTIRAKYIEQLENESYDTACSQSHLVVELNIDGGSRSGVVSIIDSVGFDSIGCSKGFTSTSYSPKDNSSEPEICTNQNEYFMYSLKNLLYELCADGNQMTVNMIGLVNSSMDCFQETLVTLELLDRFASADFDLDESLMFVDENCNTVFVPHFSLNGSNSDPYRPKQHRSPFEPISSPNEGSQRDKYKKIQISYLEDRFEDKSIIRGFKNPHRASGISNSYSQDSVISGELKRTIKKEIEGEVDKLMSKFCTKEELKDICQENNHPNIRKSVAKRQRNEIQHFTDELIDKINTKLSQRDDSSESEISDAKGGTYMNNHKDSNNTSSILFSKKHIMRSHPRFEKNNMSKLALKESVQNLSPISKGSNQDIVRQDWNELSKVEEKEDTPFARDIVMDQSDAEKQPISEQSSLSTVKKDIPDIKGEINIINNLKESLPSEFVKSFSSKYESHSQKDESFEEVKQTEEPGLSIHESSRAFEKRTKETINETAEDDVIDVEMIRVATGNSGKKQKKRKIDKQFKNEGIKIIQDSLKKAENVFGDLLTMLLGNGAETVRGRSKKRGRRSASLFACFGSKSRRKLPTEEPTETLQLNRVNSTLNDDHTLLDTKEKKKKSKKDKKKSRKDKSKSKGKNKNKSKKKKKKIEEEKDNTLEILQKTQRIPVIKKSRKLEGSQVIDLNSTFKKPDLFPHSRNKESGEETQFKTEGYESTPKDSLTKKFINKGLIDTVDLTKQTPRMAETGGQVQFSSLTKLKSVKHFKLTPRGNLHTDDKANGLKSSQDSAKVNLKTERDPRQGLFDFT
ncbi:unnamed protein product [Moneuplotes crassus]|uniref:Kinesin motor domain-containing protein n=1 Tax=Euplotes crassus TaxID=5936 RepID=A0AAD2D4D9_EUPCR|nr:unnamed protein product [Moneuplotes crassus]